MKHFVNRCEGLNGNRSYHYFLHIEIFTGVIIVCKLTVCKAESLTGNGVHWHLNCYLLGCALVTKVSVLYILLKICQG